MYFYPYKRYYTIFFSNIGIFSPETEWKTAVFSMEKETPSRKIYIFWKKYLENSNIDRKNKSSYTLIGTEYVCRGA
jgi:hypothetical protein